MPVVVPDGFASATVAREGEAGRRWIAELPAIVDELLDLWSCEVDGEVSHGGVALIVPVTRRDSSRAVMKVSFTHPGNVHEPFALAAWQGKGAVRLLERYDERYAMLLERVGPTSLAAVTDTDEAMRVAGELSQRLGVPGPAECPPLQLADWREDISRGARELPGLFDAPRALEVIDSAVPADVLVHGDLHAANILRSDREDWLAIDPKGYVGDRAFDAGMVVKWVVVRGLDTAVVSRALDVYSEAAGIDRDRARDWAHVHAVQGAYWGRRHGFRRAREGPVLDRMLSAVDDLASRLPGL